MDLDYQDFQEQMQEIVDYIGPWDRESFKDFRFAALDQWEEDDKDALREQKRPHLVLDKTRVLLDSVSGNEIVNRFEPKFYPRNLPGEDIDLEASEAIGELYRWIRQRSRVEHHESLMFRDMLICGVGCTDTYMDYTDEPDGRIVTSRVPVFQVAWDPTSQEPNFADANFVVRDKWIPEKEFLVRYPEMNGIYLLKGDLREDRSFQRLIGNVAGRDHHTYEGSRAFQFFDPKRRHVHVWEYQYRELEPVTRIMIPTPQGMEDFTVPRDDKESTLNDAYQMMEAMSVEAEAQGMPIQEELSWQDYETYKYRKAIIAGKDVIHEEDEPLRQFTLKFVTGFEDWSHGDRKYYFGLMKPMRDPQKYVNSFFSQAIHVWATSPKGVMLHEPNFFENDEEARKQWAQPNPLLATAPGVLTSTAKDKFRLIEASRSFAGSEPLFQFAQAAIPDAAGVNPAYTGGQSTDVRRAATSAINTQIQQNLTTLAPLFDALKWYRQDHAKLALGFAREYLPDNQVLRVLGPNSANLVQLTRDDLIREYDIVVGEGPTSPNKQHEILEKLTNTAILETLIELQLWPAEGWKYLGLPSDLGQQIMLRQQQLEQQMAAQPPNAGEVPPA
jgi:hypothetical protein